MEFEFSKNIFKVIYFKKGNWEDVKNRFESHLPHFVIFNIDKDLEIDYPDSEELLLNQF